MQEKSDEMMFKLEEDRTRLEEKQMELDAQLRREERDFKLQLVQMMMRQNNPPMPHYPMHSSFNYANFDPDATQDGPQTVTLIS